MTDAASSSPTPSSSAERADLLESLTVHRRFLVGTARGLTDEQARATPTASSLSVGGIIKHVTATERRWAEFMVDGSGLGATADFSDPAVVAAYLDGFRLLEDETLAGVLADYTDAAAATDALVATLDLDTSYPLPPAPWFEPGATRSVRRTIVHLVAEIAQHAGHADIIRETIDGARSMG